MQLFACTQVSTGSNEQKQAKKGKQVSYCVVCIICM